MCSTNGSKNMVFDWRKSPEHPLEIEIKFLKASSRDLAPQMYERLSFISRSVSQSRKGPPSISFQSITAGTSLHNGAASVIDSMLSYGYAVISVNDAAANTILKAYDSLLRFHSYLSPMDKKKTFQRFDGDRFIGWTRDSSREWIQMRERKHNNGTTDVPLGWPDIFPEEQRRDLTDAVHLVTSAAEDIFEEIGVLLGLGSRAYLRDLCMATCRQGSNGEGNEAKVGSSVCRQFIYLDKPTPTTTTPCPPPTPTPPNPNCTTVRANLIPAAASGCHADMGIITLSPCSTIPALNLLHPATHEMLYPEENLGPNEWILFAGESLSFLSGGTIQAPLHSVPYIDRTTLRKKIGDGPGTELSEMPPLRRSMPLFLRADPDMFLHPVTDLQWNHPSVTTCNSKIDSTLSPLTAECKVDISHIQIDKTNKMRVDVNQLFDSSSEISATLRSTESSVDEDIEVQEVYDTTKNVFKIVNNKDNDDEKHNEHENESNVECDNDKIKATMSVSGTVTGTGTGTAGTGTVKPFILSPYSMTCRRYTEDHSIGLRPWRLIKGSGDF